MSDEDKKDDKPKGKLTLGGGAKPNLSGGPKTVTVEVRKRRTITKPGAQQSVESRISNDTSLSDAEKKKRLAILQRAKAQEEKRKEEEEKKQEVSKERQAQMEEKRKAEEAERAKIKEERAAKAPPANEEPIVAGPIVDDRPASAKKPAGNGQIGLF